MFLIPRSRFPYAVAGGVLAVIASMWGYATHGPGPPTAFDALIYVVMPVAILLTGALSRGRSRRLLLSAVTLLDVEAALLGFAPLISLPFVVAVPFMGLAVSARLTPADRAPVPYLVAWLSSTVGVSAAVLGILQGPADPTLIVIPAFAGADAAAILMLYRLGQYKLLAAGAIDRAESQARDLLNGIEAFAVDVLPDSSIDFINDYALRLTGWRRDEVIGKDWWDTFATSDRREAARENFTHVVAGERQLDQQRQSRILTRSGEVRIIRWSHVHRYDPEGKLMGVASLGEDVTAINVAAEERRRYEELVTNLIRNSPLAAAVLSLDRVVQLWNPAAARLLGWSETEMIDEHVPPVFLGRDRWVIARMFAEAARGGSPEPRLVELTALDGRIVLVRFYVGAIRGRDGRPIAVSAQAEDVTAVHSMEERLREAEHMEAIGRLAGGVAHDFNNSLTAIGGFASLIASTSQEEQTRSFAGTILQASRRAADLTRELLAYSRRSLLKPQVIEVNDLLASLRPVLTSLIGPAVSLVIEAEAPSAFVRVDPGGLERAIVNLATNARDAMPNGGIVRISTRRDQVEANGRSQDWICLSVIDEGTGIPFDAQSKVFDPFFTTKPFGSGTGLGLAMVKGFVLQSGGQVDLRSEPGHGTAIHIRLPQAKEPEGGGAGIPSAEPPRGGTETILLVEDDQAVAAVGLRILGLGGYRVLLADSGTAALRALVSHPSRIDLFLVDVMLPDTRGPRLVDEAHQLHPEAAVLYASGYSAKELSRSGELPDGVKLIEKPYEPEMLLARVRSILDESKKASAAG